MKSPGPGAQTGPDRFSPLFPVYPGACCHPPLPHHAPYEDVFLSRRYRQLNSSGLNCYGGLKLLDHNGLDLITSELENLRRRECGARTQLDAFAFGTCGVGCRDSCFAVFAAVSFLASQVI